MKRCVYCGKEYPDEVTVCPVDQSAVTTDGKPIPTPKPTAAAQNQEEIRAYHARRPFAVKFAVGLLVFSMILDLSLVIFKYESSGARTRGFYSTLILSSGIVIGFLYLVFRGKNWARWVVVVSIFLGILMGPSMRIGPPHWEVYFFAIVDLVAAVGLFQRSSNIWYRGPKTFSPPQEQLSGSV